MVTQVAHDWGLITTKYKERTIKRHLQESRKTALDQGNEAFSKNKHNSASIKAAEKLQLVELCCGMNSKQDLKRSIQEEEKKIRRAV